MTCPPDEAPEPHPKPIDKKPKAPEGDIILIGTMEPKREDTIVMHHCMAYMPGSGPSRYVGTLKLRREIIISIKMVL
ncbi:uncharacterized protein DMAD_01442 [Drosophila madeirensis]|uniref:Uncharacterized protein n=1 Tax=Drosophila madeirensis TaxID=30013 RepID=A0AAU9G0X1_DROMD